MGPDAPFSFEEIRNAGPADIGAPSYFESDDGVRLAYYSFEPGGMQP
jgi:hypothetical protein